MKAHSCESNEEQTSTLVANSICGRGYQDALALLPMLFPSLTDIMWGFADVSAPCRFAMGYGAALMIGWTGLLVWACQRPIERRAVAVLTILVIGGLIITEIFSVLTGLVAFWRMVPTWALQAILLALFSIAYYYPAPYRLARADC